MYLPTEGGSVINITGTGNNSQTFVGETNTGLTLTSNFGGSTESGVVRNCIKTTNKWSRIRTIDSTVFGVDEGESVAGVDNVTDIALTSTTGARYVQSLLTITVVELTDKNS